MINVCRWDSRFSTIDETNAKGHRILTFATKAAVLQNKGKADLKAQVDSILEDLDRRDAP